MPLICLHSPKGGAGKTMLTANLASAFARTGNKVLAIDFDIQNSLRLHFGVPLTDGRGFAASACEVDDWSQFVLSPGGPLFLLPYGEIAPERQRAFEKRLEADPDRLSRGLEKLINYPGLLIVADMPCGSSPLLDALLPMIDLSIVPLLADTASLALLPVLDREPWQGSVYVINQSNNANQISRDVATIMEQRLGARLIGAVNQDECVREALARQQFVFDYSPASAAAFDIDSIANKATALLGITIGDGVVQKPLTMQGIESVYGL